MERESLGVRAHVSEALMTPARLALALPVLLVIVAWLWNAEVRFP